MCLRGHGAAMFFFHRGCFFIVPEFFIGYLSYFKLMNLIYLLLCFNELLNYVKLMFFG